MKKYLTGFTFIELLIVVMIISAFSGLSLAYYNNFNKASKLNTEANKLLQTLELAKKKATSRDVEGFEVNCANLDNSHPNNTFDGYQIVLTANGYDLKIVCKGIATPIYSYSYPKNSSGQSLVKTSPQSGTIQFNPAPGDVTFSSLSLPIQFENFTGTTAKCPHIDISTTGIIQKLADTTCSP